MLKLFKVFIFWKTILNTIRPHIICDSSDLIDLQCDIESYNDKV